MNWAAGGIAQWAWGCGKKGFFKDRQPERDVTDYYSALLEYPGVVIVNWLHSWLCPKRGVFDSRWMQVMGRVGAVDLYKGNIDIVGRQSATSLFTPEIRSIKASGFNQRQCKDAAAVRGLIFEILAKRGVTED